jgi:basic membrane protein A and related proteins
MLSHRLLAPLAALTIALGCSRSDAPDEFRVALVTPGTITDDGWNSYAYEGLQRIEKELGAKVRHFQTKAPSEFESTLRGFAADGFDLVIAHGHEYGDAATKVGAAFPNTAFLVTSGAVTAKNVASIDFAIEGPAELAGLLAGMQCKSGKVGAVGGMEIPPVVDAFRAFESGVRAGNPDASVTVAWVGSWEDVAAAKQAADALIAAGCDVLFHDADAAGFGVLNAAEEAGLVAIGCNKDQNAIKPQTVIASVVLEIPAALAAVAQEVKAGTFEGSLRHLGMKDGFVHLALNEGLAHKISVVMRRRIELRREELLR